MGCGASKPGDVDVGDKPAKAPPASKASAAKNAEPAKASAKGAAASDGAKAAGANLADAKVVFLFARDAVAAADAERQVAVVGGKVAEGLGGSYLAVPDLLRHEIREGTTLGLQLAEMIKMGKIVPPSQSVELLQRAMGERPGPFVVEGFPKSADNLRLWEEAGGSCKAALYLELADDAYSAKEVAAGKAQEDVDRRMRAFKAQTQPAIDALAGKGVLARVPLSDDNEGVAKAALEGLKAKGVEAAGGGAKAEPAGGAAAGAASAAAAPKAGGKVIFVLGGPGTGKGTQCGKLAEKYACAHFSAGDLLREEVKKGSEQGQMISDMIRDGKIVPAQVTLDLLKAAMAARDGPYLIDGFPRSADNLSAFDEQCGECALVLFFELTEEKMEERLLERGKTSGRSDDNAEAIKRRFRTFTSQSMPVVQALEAKGLVKKFDATKSIDEVFREVCAAYDAVA